MRPFSGGIELINRLRPISFTWKSNGSRDLGLGAEDVAEVEPLLVTHNERGEVEGVKYDRVSVVLINAVKEQQAEIERQQQLNERQQQVIAHLEARLLQVERGVKRRHGSRRGSTR